jgi:hypothetical protein
MNTLLLGLVLATLCVAVYLLIARLSRKDKRGRALWRKLITPTPLDAFPSGDKNGDPKIASQTAPPSIAELK